MMWLFVLGGLIASSGSPVSALCQIELSPPKVVVEYGDSFSVNCSSSSDHIEGMGWESPQGGTGFTTGISSLPLDVDSIAFWTINAQCYVTLSSGQQCTEHLPVTIYKTPGSVSMPQPSPTGPMVEGQKYRVQCDVAEVAPARNLSVQWHKGNKIFSVGEFDNSSVSPVNVSSVRELTAHRDDNGTRIWCEAMLNFLPAGPQLPPMRSKSHEVIVLYPPTFDELENETLEVPADGEVILNCNATGNPTPAYSWRCPQPAQQMVKQESENQLILTRLLQLPGTYTCTASNTQGNTTKYFTVVEAPSSRTGTTAGILLAVFFVLVFILGCVVYHKQSNSPTASPERNRSTFVAIVGVIAFLGVAFLLAGLFFVSPEGTFSPNKGNYLRGQPTSSGPLQEVVSSAEKL